MIGNTRDLLVIKNKYYHLSLNIINTNKSEKKNRIPVLAKSVDQVALYTDVLAEMDAIHAVGQTFSRAFQINSDVHQELGGHDRPLSSLSEGHGETFHLDDNSIGSSCDTHEHQIHNSYEYLTMAGCTSLLPKKVFYKEVDS